MAENPTLSLYGQTYDQIIAKVLGGSSQNFQLVNPQEDWSWEPVTSGFINAQAYRFVGQMPKWSNANTYQPGGNDMHQAYLQVLSMWNALGKGINEDQVRQAQAEVTRSRNKLQQDQQEADLGYVQYQKETPAGIPQKTYDVWMKQFWQGTIDADTLVYNKALETQALVVGQKNPGLKDAIEAATAPAEPTTPKPGFLKVNVSGTIGVRPAYIFDDPKVWADRVLAQGGNSLSISLSGTKSSYSMTKSWAGGSTGVDWGFFGLYGSGGWSRMDLETEDKSVEVNITIKAYNLFEVGPDTSWYNSGILSRMSVENDWNPPFASHGGDGKKPVFGEGGVMPLVLSGMIAGLQMVADIKMSDSNYTKYKEHWDASGGIRIGPFRIGGSGGQDKESWTKNTEKNHFHVESNAKYPFIIGITVADPGKS